MLAATTRALLPLALAVLALPLLVAVVAPARGRVVTAEASSATAFVDGVNGAVSCEACKIGLALLTTLADRNATEAEVARALTGVCVELKIQDETVCKGLIDEFAPTVWPILTYEALNPTEICRLLRFCSSSSRPRADATRSSSSSSSSSSSLSSPPVATTTTARGKSKLRVLWVSDVHIDLNYSVGSSADCGQPLCCRSWSPPGPAKAGVWGDYHCDAPSRLVSATFSAAQKQGPYDAVFWTGDSPPHDIWAQSKAYNLERVRLVTKMIAEAFPGVPVFPSLGNHDTFPVDMYSERPVDAVHHDNFQWLRTALADMWKQFPTSGSAEAQATLRKHGSYTAMLAPGLRVISLNTQWGDLFNFYLLLRSEDQQKGELGWFEATLKAARAAGERVLVIGHIPPQLSPPSLLTTYGVSYQGLIANYSDIVAGQFFAHTHDDQFGVLSDPTTHKPLSVILVVPSVTPFTEHNPSFRVLEFERPAGTHGQPGEVPSPSAPAASWNFVDFEQWWANLSAANAAPHVGPTFELEYTAKAYYDLPDMSGKAWMGLVNRMKTDSATFAKYWDAFNVRMRPLPPCDDACRRKYCCQSATADPNTFEECAL